MKIPAYLPLVYLYRARSLFSLLCFSLALFHSPSLYALDPPPTPETLAGGKVITVQQAKMIIDHDGALFIDARNPLNYGRGHVPGAKLIPYQQQSAKSVDFDATMDEYDLSMLPANRDAPMIFYSHGDTGWKSYKMAVIAIRHGYSDVMWMREGFSRWQAAGYPVE